MQAAKKACLCFLGSFKYLKEVGSGIPFFKGEGTWEGKGIPPRPCSSRNVKPKLNDSSLAPDSGLGSLRATGEISVGHMPALMNLWLLQELDLRGTGVEQAPGLDYTIPQGATEPPPNPELTGRVYLSPGAPGGEGGDPVGQSWCLWVRGRPLRSLGGGTGPASSQGSGFGPDSAEFLSPDSRVFLGSGESPCSDLCKSFLFNFLLPLMGSQAVQDWLPCFPAVGEGHPFPLGSYPI